LKEVKGEELSVAEPEPQRIDIRSAVSIMNDSFAVDGRAPQASPLPRQCGADRDKAP